MNKAKLISKNDFISSCIHKRFLLKERKEVPVLLRAGPVVFVAAGTPPAAAVWPAQDHSWVQELHPAAAAGTSPPDSPG